MANAARAGASGHGLYSHGSSRNIFDARLRPPCQEPEIRASHKITPKSKVKRTRKFRPQQLALVPSDNQHSHEEDAFSLIRSHQQRNQTPQRHGSSIKKLEERLKKSIAKDRMLLQEYMREQQLQQQQQSEDEEDDKIICQSQAACTVESEVSEWTPETPLCTPPSVACVSFKGSDAIWMSGSWVFEDHMASARARSPFVTAAACP